MTFSQVLLLFVASLLGSMLNAVAGGGTFFTFSGLLLAGVLPIQANATSTMAIWSGGVASIVAYYKDLSVLKRIVLGLLIGSSLVGGFLGALLLLKTAQATFVILLPFLLLLSTLLFIFSKSITARLHPQTSKRTRMEKTTLPVLLGVSALQLIISIYGGYFGGGIGVMMLAALALMGIDDMHLMLALKSVMGTCINGAAVLIFLVTGAVVWPHAAIAVLGAMLGGYVGAHYARKVNQRWIRTFVIAFCLSLTGYFFLQIPGVLTFLLLMMQTERAAMVGATTLLLLCAVLLVLFILLKGKRRIHWPGLLARTTVRSVGEPAAARMGEPATANNVLRKGVLPSAQHEVRVSLRTTRDPSLAELTRHLQTVLRQPAQEPSDPQQPVHTLIMVLASTIEGQDHPLLHHLSSRVPTLLICVPEQEASGGNGRAFQGFFDQEIWPQLRLLLDQRIQGVCVLDEGREVNAVNAGVPSFSLLRSLSLFVWLIGAPLLSISRAATEQVQEGEQAWVSAIYKEGGKLSAFLTASARFNSPSQEAILAHREELYWWLYLQEKQYAAHLRESISIQNEKRINNKITTKEAQLERKRRAMSKHHQRPLSAGSRQFHAHFPAKAYHASAEEGERAEVHAR